MIPLCSPSQAKLPTALALGSFDGLHAGHKKVIQAITKTGNGVPTVVSFWPHPREVLYGESKLRLYLPSEKASILENLGIKQLVLVPFDKSLAQLTAKEFFDQILLKKLQAKRIAIGANFRFGHNREGDANTLEELCAKKSIDLSVIPILEDIQGRMSSSRIRSELKKGDLKATQSLLGRAYNFRGLVIPGKGLGSKLGWPTANLRVDGRKLLPDIGVYAAWAKESDKDITFPAVMNLGPQPTIDPNAPSAVEVHLIGQEINLEGKELVVEPIERIRKQIKFKDLESLSKQITHDAKQAEMILKKI
ncbi:MULTISPECIES: bifunctional riboflavin kinase/FAD synthetase [Prochlorococcus]|uniref:bifunctional riboflavin kinase/FAD synthetase n=1 Tax=Prochlorococcus TaxID=1218 RepID=UPI000533A95A|nr:MULTISPECIES: bifunctional riboflavin kinase/FAD synthetase [Prochlorococcus]KGG12018.1 Riboflavin kinase [Prochlorococcus sp. MIT 0601]